MSLVTDAEIEIARRWWRRLPDSAKGNLSIWVLLAMYANYARERTAKHPRIAHAVARDAKAD
jgi:hypothetical protein